jgi:hypothetical protein
MTKTTLFMNIIDTMYAKNPAARTHYFDVDSSEEKLRKYIINDTIASA